MASPKHRKSGISTLTATTIGIIAGLLIMAFWQFQTQRNDSLRRGHELAKLVCERCHSVELTGKSMLPKAPPFRDLIDIFTREGMEEQLDVALTLPHAPMPPWKFSPEQANDLMTYLLQLSKDAKQAGL